jgi:hypothetical protein
VSANYRKLAQLPSGLDLQKNILLSGDASGKNWVVADGGDFKKRPGLRPVLALPATDATASGYAATGTLLRFPQGALVAAEYVVGNQMRQYSYEKLTSGTDTVYIYNSTQLVYISDGRPFVIRKIPLMYMASVSGETYSYRFGTNPTTGALQFVLRDSTGAINTSYTVTESSTIAALATAISATVVDVGYTQAWSTSRMPGLSFLYAACVEKTDGSTWLNLDPTNNFIYGYASFEMPMSNPTGNSTLYRCFYTQDVNSVDGNVVGVQFQEEMIFAGRGDALMSFDGYRMSVAGCNVLSTYTAANVGSGGSLGAGSYTYIFRPKTTKPSGQITYGPVSTVSETGIAWAPRRVNSFTDLTGGGGSPIMTISAAERLQYYPQVGEYVTSDTRAGRVLIAQVTGNTITGDVDYFDGGGKISLGEEVEIFRNAVGGTSYYQVGTMAINSTYVDTMSDATLATKSAYVAKTYTITRPPDFCYAATVHQNRIVVIGEYFEGQAYPATPLAEPIKNSRLLAKNLYWSEPNNEEFTATNNLILDITEGGDLNSCISVGDTLYVGGAESMWLIQGSLASATTYTVNRVTGAAGTVGNTAICALNGQVYAVGRAGLYTLNGGSADYAIGQPVNALIRQVEPALLPFTRLVALKRNAGLALILPGMVLERPAIKLAAGSEVFPVSYVATEDAADTIALIWEPNSNTWSQWQGVDMYLAGGLVEFDGMTWAFPRKTGKPIAVLDSEYGYDGFSSAVEMQVKGPWQTNDDIFTDKSFVRLRVLSASQGRQNFTLATKVERNWNSGQAEQEFNVSFRSSEGYGQRAYGVYPYGDPSEAAQQVALTNQKALSVRAVFENSNPAEFPSISGWNFEVAQPRGQMKDQ